MANRKKPDTEVFNLRVKTATLNKIRLLAEYQERTIQYVINKMLDKEVKRLSDD